MILTSTRRNAYLTLAGIALPPGITERLATVGITTLDELRDHWIYGNQRLIAEFLGESPLRFASYRPLAGATRGKAAAGPGSLVNLLAAGRLRPLVQHPRGVLLSAAERKPTAEPPEPLPPVADGVSRRVVSLAGRFPAVRNQGQRGTCVAFSAVALLEYHLHAAATGGTKPSAAAKRHAEQFVYWACKEQDGRPYEEGTFVGVARGVLRKFGACLNKTWPYVALPVGPSEGQGPPPDGAEAEALDHVWRKTRPLTAKIPDRIREQIDEQRPVVLSVKTFPSWDYPTTQDTGEIPLPMPGQPYDGGHAICVVGYELGDAWPGGGAFIFRNSWGSKWAKAQGRFGAGYGSLPFAYVRKYGLEAFA